MKQNKYDHEHFFAKYSQMPRSVQGLQAAGEWPAFRSLLPDLNGQRVLDLGCGFGWHCRYAREQGAEYVLGIDLSSNMLSKAQELTNDSAIEYRQAAIEELKLENGSFDLVLSSLALHYVDDFQKISDAVFDCVKAGGRFVFSVEHPIFTSIADQDWIYSEEGAILHWPVDHYQHEGQRNTAFLGEQVVKYHRTLAAYVGSLLNSGFQLEKLLEPQPTEEAIAKYPAMIDETRRPMFLLIAAVKPAR